MYCCEDHFVILSADVGGFLLLSVNEIYAGSFIAGIERTGFGKKRNLKVNYTESESENIVKMKVTTGESVNIVKLKIEGLKRVHLCSHLLSSLTTSTILQFIKHQTCQEKNFAPC